MLTADLSTGISAADLVADLVGPDVKVSNVVYTGANVAAGRFAGDGPLIDGTIGFESGIVLSTGRMRDVAGVTADTRSTNNNTPGDADLGAATFDAAVLEFDFQTRATQLTLQYVLASEEYTQAVPNLDPLRFLVDGLNVAVLPDATATPVAINTVPGTPRAETAMNGVTAVLTARINVTPNVKHHLKLAIADIGNALLDSNVFLKASSLTQALTPTVAQDTSLPPGEVRDENTPTGRVLFVNGRVLAVRNVDDEPVNQEIIVQQPRLAPGQTDVDHPDVVFVGGVYRDAVGVRGGASAAKQDIVIDDATAILGTVRPVAVGGVNAVVLGGRYLDHADLDGDPTDRELIVQNPRLAQDDRTVAAIDNDADGVDVVFIGGAFLTARNIDADANQELFVRAPKLRPGDVVARDLDGAAGDDFFALNGKFLGAANLDNDPAEQELVFLADTLKPGQTIGRSLDAPDTDFDILFIGGKFQQFANVDNDALDREILIHNPRLGAGVTAVQDLDRDGDIDLIMFGGPFLLLANLDNNAAESEVVVQDAKLAPGLTVARDLDGDGDNDLVVVNGKPIRAGNIENRAADPAPDQELLVHDRQLASGVTITRDLDADGDIDVVFIGGKVVDNANVDNDAAEQEIILQDPRLPAGVDVAKDLDSDGDADLVIAVGKFVKTANVDNDPNEVEVIVQNAAVLPAPFTTANLETAAAEPGADPDIITVSGKFLANAATGNDPRKQKLLVQDVKLAIDAVETRILDNDNEVDLVIVGANFLLSANVTHIANEQTDQEFILVNPTLAPGATATRNLDNDTDLDLIFVSARPAKIVAADNDPEDEELAVTDTRLTPGAPVAANLDGDGDDDVITTKT